MPLRFPASQEVQLLGQPDGTASGQLLHGAPVSSLQLTHSELPPATCDVISYVVLRSVVIESGFEGVRKETGDPSVGET